MAENSTYAQKCDLLIKEPEIRFAGFLDMMGNLVVGKFKESIIPLKDDNDRKRMFMEAVLRVRTRQEFDENLGSVTYAAARYSKKNLEFNLEFLISSCKDGFTHALFLTIHAFACRVC